MTKAEILATLPKLSALVVGDICLDRWCRYDPAAADISRETGIPRIGVVAVETTAGAAGTVANNLADLGVGRVALMGVIGEDGHGWELRRALQRRHIEGELIVQDPSVPTFTYTKLINRVTEVEDLPRVDFIPETPPPGRLEELILEHLEQFYRHFDVVFVSDQAETETGGVVTRRVREKLAELAPAHPETLCWVDSRVRPEHFRNVCLKPNRGEAEAASRRAFGEVDFARLRAHTRAPLLMITDGPESVLLYDDAGERRIPTRPVENPVDICGAGDSFAAGAAMALKATGDAETAARFGHAVASITIMKKGTGTATPAELLAAQ